MFSDVIIHNTNFKEVYTTSEVAKNYQVSENTIRDHLNNHNDEFIENIHYFYTINPRFKTKILNWTLEGVYMLGFFIKSPQAKIYRKKVAEFLRICKEREDVKFREKISNLQAINISKERHHNNQINGYKSQISQKNALISELKTELKRYGELVECQISSNYPQADKYTLALYSIQKDLELMFRKIGAVMGSMNGDDFFMKQYFD